MADPGRRPQLQPPSGGLSPERRVAVASDVVAQIGHPPGVRSAVEALGMVIRPEENVVCAATGFVQGRTCLVLLTSSRLVILRGRNVIVDLDHKTIRRFRALTGVSAHDLQLENAQGNVLVIKQVYPRSRLDALAQVLAGGGRS